MTMMESHTIYLRPIEENDVTNGEWHNWFNNYELTAFNSHGVYPLDIKTEKEIFLKQESDHSSINLAICSKDGEVIGTVSLNGIDLLHKKAEIACMLAVKASPTSALEAIGLLVEHGFNRLNLHRIYGGAHEGLSEWVAMLNCLGFKVEGRLREDFLRLGEFKDTIRFSLLREEFLELKKEREDDYLHKNAGLLYKSAISNLKKIKNEQKT